MIFNDKKLTGWSGSVRHLRARGLMPGIAGKTLVEARERLEPGFDLRADPLDHAVHHQIDRADECDGRTPEHAGLRRHRENMRCKPRRPVAEKVRSEEHTYELQSLMRISYAVFCLKTKKT